MRDENLAAEIKYHAAFAALNLAKELIQVAPTPENQANLDYCRKMFEIRKSEYLALVLI